MTSPVDFSTGDIRRAASDKSPFHRGSEARHRRVWKGLWKVYYLECSIKLLSAQYLDGYENDFRVRLAETNSALECSPNLQVLNNTIEHATKSWKNIIFAVPGVFAGEGINSARLFKRGERKALAKFNVHQQVEKLSSLTKFIADDFFLPAKIVKTTKSQISLPCFSYCNRGKVKES
jgi:hypothetical protein